MAPRGKLWLNLMAIIFAATAGIVVNYEVDEMSATFIAIRVAEVNVFAKLVRDNWDGIKSVSDDKKRILLQTLDSGLAGIEIRMMRDAIIILFYALVGSIIVDRAFAMFRLWRATRPRQPAP